MPVPRPTPRRSGPPPRPTPGPPSAGQRFQRVAEEEFGRIRREELTAAQRRSIEGVAFRTVPSIGRVGGREVAGRTFFRQGPAVTRAVQRVLQATGKQPREGIRIAQSAKKSSLASAVRHETAHVLLFKAGVPAAQQEKVLSLARVGTTGAAGFALLPQATRVAQHAPGRSRDQAAKQLRQRLTIRARRLRAQK